MKHTSVSLAGGSVASSPVACFQIPFATPSATALSLACTHPQRKSAIRNGWLPLLALPVPTRRTSAHRDGSPASVGLKIVEAAVIILVLVTVLVKVRDDCSREPVRAVTEAHLVQERAQGRCQTRMRMAPSELRQGSSQPNARDEDLHGGTW